MRLFYKKNVSSIEDDVVKKISNELTQWRISQGEIDARLASIMQVYFNYNVPGLEEGSFGKLTLEDENGKEYSENLNAEYPTHSVYATGNYGLQFSGDKNLFDVKPNSNKELEVSVEIQANFLTFKIRTGYVRLSLTEEWKQFLRDKALQVKQDIEHNLKELKADLNIIRGNVERRVKDLIEKNIQIAKDEEQRNQEITPF